MPGADDAMPSAAASVVHPFVELARWGVLPATALLTAWLFAPHPVDGGGMPLPLLSLAWWVTFLPIVPLAPAARAGWFIGSMVGLLHAHAWVWHAARPQWPLPSPTLALLLVLLAFLHTSARWLLLRQAARLPRWGTVPAVALAVACGGAVLRRASPWTGPLTFGWLGADLPGGLGVVRFGGLEGVAVLSVALACAVLLRQWRWAAGAGAVWALAAFAPSATPVSEPLVVAAMDRVPAHGAPGWRRTKVEAMEAAEAHVEADVIVWAEGAYPMVERADGPWEPAGWSPPSSSWRVFGADLRGPSGIRNVVGVQGPGAPVARLRDKEFLVPVGEAPFYASQAQRRVLSVAGHRVAMPICYELLQPRFFAGESFDLVVSISSSRFDPTGRSAMVLDRGAQLRAALSGRPVLRISEGSPSVGFDRRGAPLPTLQGTPGATRFLVGATKAARQPATLSP